MIIRDDDKQVTLASLADDNAEQETQYLLANATNAERLLRSLAQARTGLLMAHELIEE
ncbi:prevent-host-death protein [Methylovulum psychrotolerans]|uniref:Uncharacterized protein n=1 Tax=Methylovulum psychrotolerans TaxID=1704499 RepID=A0A2S5CNL3_9GAMM|nr:prevent-host-death protein [Methylovulum psychrotolerans]POZ52347.1 hypothetical protein AADEFJLK_01829 [Methylovulum psychrotolerans]